MSDHKDHAPSADTGRGNDIELDLAGLFSSAVGPQGLDEPLWAQAEADRERAHGTLEADLAGGSSSRFAALTLGETMCAELPAIVREGEALRQFEDIVVIGIGGSSLGAKAVYHALTPDPTRAPRLHFLENADPDGLTRLLARLEPARTALVAVSKSGRTLETVAQFLILRGWLRDRLGANGARQHQWIVTDPREGWLRELAREERLPALAVPPDVGGRFSVLSAVGLLPLAAVGIPIADLLAGARAQARRCQTSHDNPALALASAFVLLDLVRDKRISILMPYADRLRLLGDWYRQLWAESLGKRRTDGTPVGMLPVLAAGTVDQHSQLQMYLESRPDKVFSFVEVDNCDDTPRIPSEPMSERLFPYLSGQTLAELLHAECHATRATVTESGHPNLTLRLPRIDAASLGQVIDLYQRATIYAGLLYGVNPLDQPAVERGKQLAIEGLMALGGKTASPRD